MSAVMVWLPWQMRQAEPELTPLEAQVDARHALSVAWLLAQLIIQEQRDALDLDHNIGGGEQP